MIDIDRLHRSYRNSNSRGNTTRMLVEAIQNVDFNASWIIVVAHNQKFAVELSRRAIVIAESIGFRSVIRLNNSEILVSAVKISFMSQQYIFGIPEKATIFIDEIVEDYSFKKYRPKRL